LKRPPLHSIAAAAPSGDGSSANNDDMATEDERPYHPTNAHETQMVHEGQEPYNQSLVDLAHHNKQKPIARKKILHQASNQVDLYGSNLWLLEASEKKMTQ
jgi:hypothetical protein